MKYFISSKMYNRDLVKALTLKIATLRDDLWCIQTWPDEETVPGPERTPEISQSYARRDLHEIDMCDTLVLLTIGAHETYAGGLHTEYGYALAQKKYTIVVGPRMNVFHYIANEHYETIDAFLMSLMREQHV